MILNESLFEEYGEIDNTNGWEEIASKDVMDSDGFYTDYVWYTNGKKHIFMFGDSDIYEPDEDYADWEIEIYPGNEQNAYDEAQEWFDNYKGFDDNAEDEDILEEDFSSSLPKWLTTYLENNPKIKKQLATSKHLDLANMEYVKVPRSEIPLNGFHPLIKDGYKQLVYLLRDNSNKNIVYFPGLNQDLTLRIDEDDQYKETRVENISIKKLLQYVVAMGYIDRKDDSNLNSTKQSLRVQAKKDVIERGKGQYSYNKDVYPIDPETGRRDYSVEPTVTKEWDQTKGQDKSGYVLKPDKYKNMLDQADMSTYGRQYDRYTKKLMDLKDAIVVELQNMRVDKSIGHGWGSGLQYALRYLEDAINSYENLQKEIERILSYKDLTDEEKNKYIQDEFDANKSFNSISELRKDIEKAWKELNGYKEKLNSINNDNVLEEDVILPDVDSDKLQKLAKKHNVDILSSMGNGDLRLSGAGADLMKFYQEASEKGLWEVDPSLYEELNMHNFPEFKEIANSLGMTTAGDIKLWREKYPVQDDYESDLIAMKFYKEDVEEIAKQVGLKIPDDIETFKREEMQEGETLLIALERYKKELIDAGVDLSTLVNESIIRYPNGMEVTDVDLDAALSYMYGTDRNMDNSTYTDEEKQRAVDYWMEKTDPSPYKDLNEGAVKDIAIDLEAGEDFVSILKRDLIPAKKELYSLKDMKNKKPESVTDDQIMDAEEKVSQIEAKLKYLKSIQQ